MFRSLLLILLLYSTILSQAQSPQSMAHSLQQAGPVNDFAALLTVAEELKLVQQIDSIEQSTQMEYVICMIDDLKGNNIKDLAVAIGNEWGIGKADTDNGVVILISKRPRKVFIATGLGIQAQLANEDVQYIVDNHVIPYLKKDNFYQGLSTGIQEMQNALNGTSIIEREDNSLITIISILFFIGIVSYILYDYRKLGGFDPKMRKFIRNRRGSGGPFIGDSSGSGRSSSGGSFGGGGGGAGGDY